MRRADQLTARPCTAVRPPATSVAEAAEKGDNGKKPDRNAVRREFGSIGLTAEKALNYHFKVRSWEVFHRERFSGTLVVGGILSFGLYANGLLRDKTGRRAYVTLRAAHGGPRGQGGEMHHGDGDSDKGGETPHLLRSVAVGVFSREF